MCTFLLQNVALWDMAQVHSGICEMGPDGNGGFFYKHGSTLSNHSQYKVWCEITYLFPNFNGCTVWEWKRNFTSLYNGHVITYPYWNLSKTMSVKGTPGLLIRCGPFTK